MIYLVIFLAASLLISVSYNFYLKSELKWYTDAVDRAINGLECAKTEAEKIQTFLTIALGREPRSPEDVFRNPPSFSGKDQN